MSLRTPAYSFPSFLPKTPEDWRTPRRFAGFVAANKFQLYRLPCQSARQRLGLRRLSAALPANAFSIFWSKTVLSCTACVGSYTTKLGFARASADNPLSQCN
jgi:hypothetical protein